MVCKRYIMRGSELKVNHQQWRETLQAQTVQVVASWDLSKFNLASLWISKHSQLGMLESWALFTQKTNEEKQQKKKSGLHKMECACLCQCARMYNYFAFAGVYVCVSDITLQIFRKPASQLAAMWGWGVGVV